MLIIVFFLLSMAVFFESNYS